MHRFLTLPALLAAGFSLCAWGAEKDQPAEGVSVPEELHAIHQLLDRQSKELDAINEQISHLRQRLDAQEAVTSGQPSPASVAVTPNAGLPAPAPAPAPAPEPATSPAPAAPEAASAEVPKAEATGGGVKHIVAKGETLTSIAKQYNISVTALHAANKAVNDRKLQIGQVLSIPTTNPPEPPSPPAAEKKENP